MIVIDPIDPEDPPTMTRREYRNTVYVSRHELARTFVMIACPDAEERIIHDQLLHAELQVRRAERQNRESNIVMVAQIVDKECVDVCVQTGKHHRNDLLTELEVHT